MSAEEPIGGYHEIHRDTGGEELFDLALDHDAKGKGGSRRCECGVGWIDEVAGKQAGVRCIGFETEIVEYACYLIVTVARATAKTV